MERPLGEQLGGLGELLLDDSGIDEALAVALELARTSVGGEPAVSLTVRPRDDRGPSTRAATDPVARRLDEWQYEHDEGPCVRADEQQAICAVDDLAHDDSFPTFAHTALAVGVQGVASFPLVVRGTSIGSMNLFYREAGVLDEAVLQRGGQLATTVAPMLANFLTHERTLALTGQLEEALEGRAVIERAKGLLMGQLGVDADRAFDLLSTQSQHENRKLREVAAGLLAKHEATDAS